MKTSRTLQLCIALMAAIATLMLGHSQESPMLCLAAVTVPAAAWLLTDVLGVALHRYLAGAAGVCLVATTLLRSQDSGLDTQFVSVANLLIYLQWILLFQRKVSRVYWQLIVLSLLQVVVASALNLFVLYGPLLVSYVAVALWALLLFFIQRETQPFLQGAVAEPVVDTSQSAGIIDGEPATFPGQVFAKTVTDPQKTLVKQSFLRHYILLSCSSVVVSAAVFLLMPRFGDGVWRGQTRLKQTGYSGEVDLDDSSAILESPAVVMRVSFVDESKDKPEPYEISGVPYLRGGVLDQYIPRGRWANEREADGGLPQLREAKSIYSVVRQDITMERQRGGTVFSVSPASRIESSPESIMFHPATHEIVYKPGDDDDPAQYSIGTTAFRNGTQSRFVPKTARTSFSEQNRLQVLRRLPKLSALAQQIIDDAGVTDDDVLRKARSLEAHFANSGLYKYSLDPSPDRNYGEDPVEDFVTNHRTGHCQYYASALTLMLRSLGIPARIVVGYHGGVYNAVGNYYQIREMDAHAWVEAMVPADQIPTDETLPMEGFDIRGAERPDAWVRLDPTPSGGGYLQRNRLSPWRAQLNDAIDYVQLLWSEYVLGLNQRRQKKRIYEPIQRAFNLVFDGEMWAARWQALRDRLRNNLLARENFRDAVIVIAVFSGLVYLLRVAWRILYRMGRRTWSRRNAARRPQVEFYRRLESILGRHGMRRRGHQTPREYALAAAESLRRSGDAAAAADIPAEVVDAFYSVRFGGRRLLPGDVQRLEGLLHRLQRVLGANRGRGR